MKKVYIVSGYNSWINKEITKAFSIKKEAETFLEGLTNPLIQTIQYKNTAQLVNSLLEVK